MSNWDFKPPSATILVKDLTRYAKISEIKPIMDSNNRSHIIPNLNLNLNSVWFCSPGFFEYHEFYPVDSWNQIRNKHDGKIYNIIENAISHIDRT